MFNSQRPHSDDLPTNRQLLGATAFAVAAAAAILVTIVLPSDLRSTPRVSDAH